MALPGKIPTLEVMTTKNWTRPDNVWCTANTTDCFTGCYTEPRLRGPGTDHVPIISVLDIPVPQAATSESYNFRMTDWDDFRDELEARLGDISGPNRLTTEEDFQRAADELTGAIQDTIRTTVPESKPCPHSRRWWSKELSDLKWRKNRLENESYKNRRLQDHPIHVECRQVRNAY
ncbi:hypothetical protein PLICRDRAFT_115774, partial [Plicaturopsis crispa FD-325 SS-3]